MRSAITLVSGLPRSGTSMMMEMLEAGGMEVLIDNVRRADEDNPNGYYEFERAKQIKRDTSWLKHARGKVFKMVSILLYDLPRDESYKIIFMRRKMEEILVSQRLMMQRNGVRESNISDEEMASIFESHVGAIEDWLQKQGNMDVLYVDYSDVVENPQRNAEAAIRFLLKDLNVRKMVEVVDKALYRNRATNE